MMKTLMAVLALGVSSRPVPRFEISLDLEPEERFYSFLISIEVQLPKEMNELL